MRIGSGVLLILFLGMPIASGLAQDAKVPEAIPAGRFQFEGAWDCAGSFGNGKTHRSTFTGKVILGGKWLELTEQDIEPATGYLAGI